MYPYHSSALIVDRQFDTDSDPNSLSDRQHPIGRRHDLEVVVIVAIGQYSLSSLFLIPIDS